VIGGDIGWTIKILFRRKKVQHNLLARLQVVFSSWQRSTTGDLPTATEETSQLSQGRPFLELPFVGGKQAKAHSRFCHRQSTLSRAPRQAILV